MIFTIDLNELYLSLLPSCSVIICEIVKLLAFCAQISDYKFNQSLFVSLPIEKFGTN
jgi:hypothetical protein